MADSPIPNAPKPQVGSKRVLHLGPSQSLVGGLRRRKSSSGGMRLAPPRRTR